MENVNIVASLAICIVTSVTSDCIPHEHPAVKGTELMDLFQITTSLNRKLALWRLPGSAVICPHSLNWKGQNIGTTLNFT